MNYKVIESGELDAFRGKVIEAMLDGWALQGGVAIIPVGDGGFFYAQAVTKPVRDKRSEGK